MSSFSLILITLSFLLANTNPVFAAREKNTNNSCAIALRAEKKTIRFQDRNHTIHARTGDYLLTSFKDFSTRGKVRHWVLLKNESQGGTSTYSISKDFARGELVSLRRLGEVLLFKARYGIEDATPCENLRAIEPNGDVKSIVSTSFQQNIQEFVLPENRGLVFTNVRSLLLVAKSKNALLEGRILNNGGYLVGDHSLSPDEKLKLTNIVFDQFTEEGRILPIARVILDDKGRKISKYFDYAFGLHYQSQGLDNFLIAYHLPDIQVHRLSGNTFLFEERDKTIENDRPFDRNAFEFHEFTYLQYSEYGTGSILHRRNISYFNGTQEYPPLKLDLPHARKGNALWAIPLVPETSSPIDTHAGVLIIPSPQRPRQRQASTQVLFDTSIAPLLIYSSRIIDSERAENSITIFQYPQAEAAEHSQLMSPPLRGESFFSKPHLLTLDLNSLNGDPQKTPHNEMISLNSVVDETVSPPRYKNLEYYRGSDIAIFPNVNSIPHTVERLEEIRETNLISGDFPLIALFGRSLLDHAQRTTISILQIPKNTESTTSNLQMILGFKYTSEIPSDGMPADISSAIGKFFANNEKIKKEYSLPIALPHLVNPKDVSIEEWILPGNISTGCLQISYTSPLNSADKITIIVPHKALDNGGRWVLAGTNLRSKIVHKNGEPYAIVEADSAIFPTKIGERKGLFQRYPDLSKLGTIEAKAWVGAFHIPLGYFVRGAELPGPSNDAQFDSLGNLEIHGKSFRGTTPVNYFMLSSESDHSNGGQNAVLIHNMKPSPVYEDNEYTIIASDPHGMSAPQLFLYNKSEGRYREVELSFELDHSKIDRSPVDEYHSEIFSKRVSDGSHSKISNEEKIVEVKRDGTLLYILTQGLKSPIQNAYIYDIENRKVSFYIPNFLGHVYKVGEFRFFVGAPSYKNQTQIVVLDKYRNRFLRSFNLGNLSLDTSNDSPIFESADGHLIGFRLSNGTTRYYDRRIENFRGLLAPKLSNLIQESKLFLLNEIYFSQPQRPYLLRNSELQQLESHLTLKPELGEPAKRLLLIGNNGAGRKGAYKELIRRYIDGEYASDATMAPVFARFRPIDQTSDTSYRGQYSDNFVKIRKTAQELARQGHRLILVIDDLDSWRPESSFHRSGEGDIFDQFKTLLEDPFIDIIATGTPDGLALLSRSYSSIVEAFDRITIQSFQTNETVQAIEESILRRFENRVLIDHNALDRLVQSIPSLNLPQSLPGSAFSIIEEVIKVEQDRNSTTTPLIIGEDALRRGLSKATGIPAILLDSSHCAEMRQELLNYLNRRVLSQPEACEALANAAFNFCEGTQVSQWPIFSILALGPTGVGKTEAITAFMEFFFGTNANQHIVRINGEDFSDGSSRSSHEIKTNILEMLLKRPFSLILFDEFEKMRKDARDMMLALLDGKISKPSGETVHTSLALVYMTSNLGAAQAKENLKKELQGPRFREREMNAQDIGTETRARWYQNALESFLTPEQIGRVQPIVFRTLGTETAENLIQSYLDGTLLPSFAKAGYSIQIDSSVVNYFAKKVFDPSRGARGLHRSIDAILTRGFLTRARAEGSLSRERTHTVYYSERNQSFELR